MTKHASVLSMVLVIITLSVPAGAEQAGPDKAIEAVKQSVVYLQTAFYGYEPLQPWRHKALTHNQAYGCAVGEYEVVTTAWNVANLAFVRALRYGQNEFIGAKIKLVDYQSNLCLIELDRDAMTEPLKPLVFSEDYPKGSQVRFYWLSSDNRAYSGRGYLDRARVEQTNVSYEKRLHYVVANTSRRTGTGQLYCVDSATGPEPIGIACWSNDDKEAGLVPGELINRFLAAAKEDYKGFGAIGFATSELLDPAMRSYLKMPPELKNGVYVSDVYTLGTGSDVLAKGDVILTIDGKTLNSYGRFEHPKYGWLDFEHLITTKTVGRKVLFELWRGGHKEEVSAKVKNFKASEMLVPYHEYGVQPEYAVIGGFVLQKLTREYLMRWGDDWAGKVSPHLYHYYRDLAYKPGPERKDIVILSYVLPAEINLGYKDLRQIVVSKFNGMKVSSISDIIEARKLNPDSEYHVIEFEMDNPTVVIPRDQLRQADMFISRNYGIRQLEHINPG